MIPSASVRLISVRSASKTVSTKMMSTGSCTNGRARLTAPAVPSCTFCSMKRDGNRVARARVGLDLLLEVAGDEDQLAHVQAVEPVHHPVHDRPARHLEHRLGDQMGVGPETGALPGERDDHLHVSLFRSGPGAGRGRRAPGVDASRTSLSTTASIWCTSLGGMWTVSPALNARDSELGRRAGCGGSARPGARASSRPSGCDTAGSARDPPSRAGSCPRSGPCGPRRARSPTVCRLGTAHRALRPPDGGGDERAAEI